MLTSFKHAIRKVRTVQSNYFRRQRPYDVVKLYNNYSSNNEASLIISVEVYTAFVAITRCNLSLHPPNRNWDFKQSSLLQDMQRKVDINGPGGHDMSVSNQYIQRREVLPLAALENFLWTTHTVWFYGLPFG